MKRLLLSLTALVGLFSLSTAHALLELSFGAHVGAMEFDNISGSEVIAGANVGYKFKDFVVADLAVDVELNTSLDDFTTGSIEQSYDSTALYLTTKTLGPIYVIGRAGIISADLGSQSDDGTAVAVGVGFSLGTQIELTVRSISFDDHFGDAEQIYLRFGF